LFILHVSQIAFVKPHYDILHRICHWCGFIASGTIFFKAIDPVGDHNIIPRTLLVISLDVCTHLIVLAVFLTALRVCSICHNDFEGYQQSQSEDNQDYHFPMNSSAASSTSRSPVPPPTTFLVCESPVPRRLGWILLFIWTWLFGTVTTLDICLLFSADEWLRSVVLCCSAVSFLSVFILIECVGRDFHRTFINVAPDIFDDDLFEETPSSAGGQSSQGYLSIQGSENKHLSIQIKVSSRSQSSRMQSRDQNCLEEQVTLLKSLRAKYKRFMLLKRLTSILCIIALVVQVGRAITLILDKGPFIPKAGTYDIGDDILTCIQCSALIILLWYAWEPLASPLECFGIEISWRASSIDEGQQETAGEAQSLAQVHTNSSFFGSFSSFSPSNPNSRTSEVEK